MLCPFHSMEYKQKKEHKRNKMGKEDDERNRNEILQTTQSNSNSRK